MNYREVEGLNYSTLCIIESNNPQQAFVEKEKKESQAMDRGSLVDCLLTNKNEFDNLFVIEEIPEITESVQKILKSLPLDKELDDLKKEILVEAKFNNYGNNWKEDTLLSKIVTEESRKYFKFLKESRMIISQQDYDQALKIIEILTTHPFTKETFELKENEEILFQYPVYWNEKNISCKALLDICKINHKIKTIEPFDLKVKSENIYNFLSSFVRYKYYLQAAWYTKGLKAIYPEYTVNNFKFLVTNFFYPNTPLIYTCSSKLLDAATYGTDKIMNEVTKGVNKLLEDYIWYKENPQCLYPREIYESRGIINI